MVTLGELVKLVNDNEFQPLKNGVTKYVGGQHLKSRKLYVTKYGDIEKDQEVIGSAFHRKFKKNQLLYGTRNPHLRKSGIVTFDGICANTTLVLDVNGKQLLHELMPFIFQWDDFIEYSIQMAVGSTNPYVRWRDIAAFKFNLPNIPIQKKIVNILNSVQKSIDESENLLEKLVDYKNSFINEFTNKKIDKNQSKKIKWFYKKEITISKNWKLSKLKEICSKITDGTHQSPKFIEKEFHFCLFQTFLTEKLILKLKNLFPMKLIMN